MMFCTSIHCMDGRIQEPVLKYLKDTYHVRYVDTITEPGPCKILAEHKNATAVQSIMERLRISIDKHGSRLVAVSGHHDCAGNNCHEEAQKQQIKESIRYLKNSYPDIKIVGLWMNEEWQINVI